MKSGTFLRVDSAAVPVVVIEEEEGGDDEEEEEDAFGVDDETLSAAVADVDDDDDMDAIADEAVSLMPCRALKLDHNALVLFFLGSDGASFSSTRSNSSGMHRVGMLDHAPELRGEQ